MSAAARYRPPAAAAAVPRPRLLALLDGARRARLTLLVAPAGFGKTTALASWAQARSAPDVRLTWLSLTDRDDTPEGFGAALLGSFQATRPPLAGLAEAAAGWTRFEQLAARLVTLVGDAGEEVVTIIDAADRAPAAAAAAGYLVDLAPPAWHFVAASRVPTFTGLARLRAAGELVEIGAAELRFDHDEILRLLTERGLAPGAAAAVEAASGGWPSAVEEAAAQAHGAGDRAGVLTALAAGESPVGRAVTGEAIRVLTPAARAVLADAALLRHADGEAWAAVAGDERGSAAYRDAVAAQLLVPVDDRWYRAHPPLRHMSDAALAADAERRSEVLGRAARWAAAAGLAEDAVTYAFAGGDEAYGTELITEYARQFTGRGHPDRLLRLVDALDPGLARRPPIAAERGWAAVLAGDLDELAAVVSELDEPDVTGAPPPLAAGVFRTALRLLEGDAAAALATARAMTTELDRRAPRLQTGSVGPGWAWAFHAAAAAMAGDFEQARNAAKVVVEGGFPGQPLILGAGVHAIIELYGDATARAAALARLAMSVADVELEADLPVCAPALFVLAHDENPVEAARALARLRRVSGTAPSPYVEVLVLLAEAAQAARAGRDPEDVKRTAARAQTVANATREGVPGLGRFIGGVEDQIAAAAALPAIDSRLSEAELGVLRLMSRQLTRREIGVELGISLNTVKFHARSVLRKLGATSTVEAVERGRQLGILPEASAD